MNNETRQKIEDDTIETWKLDLSELIWCMVNSRPTKVIRPERVPSQVDIDDYITKLLDQEKKAHEDKVREEAVMGLVEHVFDFEDALEDEFWSISISKKELVWYAKQYLTQKEKGDKDEDN